ncbi:MAG: outer membrane receptor protein involved in Fe transport [Pseudohongiellaceae bacterium]|jgi:outer membrane receptor protein involved in Fe transport
MVFIHSKCFIFLLAIFLTTNTYGQGNEQDVFAGNEADLDVEELEVISISASSDTHTIEKSGLNANVISTVDYLNTTKSISQLLNETPGIVVRENGGLGAAYDLSLNGLSGDQVRYFLDGIPMENFGSALGLNNIPINLVERVEVYKGVVPVSLGSDALAGAINIITPDVNESLFDASYSYGSFNTHRIALLGQTSNLEGYFLRTSGYFNYSDNDYTMDSVPETDDLGNIINTISVDRFNDEYQSSMVSLKAGRTNFSWADELSLTLTYADNKDNQQHPSTSTNIVFGEVHSHNETYLLSGLYKKQFNRLFIKSYVLTGNITEKYYDTASRRYDWEGNSTGKSTETQGELGNLSIFEREDRILRFNLSGDYSYNQDTTFSLNLSSNTLDRDGSDRIDTVNPNFTLPNSVDKNVLGLNYSQSIFDDDLNVNLFVKQYEYSANVGSRQDIDGVVQNDETEVDLSNTGYGFSLHYQLSEANRIRTSFEKAYRLPEPDEILGSGQLIRANPNLTAELSDNLNIGFISEYKISSLFMKSEINGFYRDASDFISYDLDQGIKGIYKNTNSVEVKGVEAAFSFDWNQRFDLQINGTYQDIIDKTKVLVNGDSNSQYGERLPNKPYLYANLRTGFNHTTNDLDKFSVHWSSHFVERYFFYSENSGDKRFKRDIPAQFTHDIDLEYSMNYGTYNIALNASNIFDKQVFDNHKIQKPGRAFYLKFRYSH